MEREYIFVKNHTRHSPSLCSQDDTTETTYTRKKSELHVLEQSGIYQIDLSNVRNEIPPVAHEPLPPVYSAPAERSYRRTQRPRKNNKKLAVDQKWRDDCDCLRCGIIRRQYTEGDLKSYQNWGNYPCMNLTKCLASTDRYCYDSD